MGVVTPSEAETDSADGWGKEAIGKRSYGLVQGNRVYLYSRVDIGAGTGSPRTETGLIFHFGITSATTEEVRYYCTEKSGTDPRARVNRSYEIKKE